jgi:hypothetical protein
MIYSITFIDFAVCAGKSRLARACVISRFLILAGSITRANGSIVKDNTITIVLTIIPVCFVRNSAVASGGIACTNS